MPRRNYANGRQRPYAAGDTSLQHLADRRPFHVTPGVERPCQVCHGVLAADWPFPEHAACRDTPRRVGAA
jgi:hypothetical protein